MPTSLFLAVGTVTTLLMMMFSSATTSSSESVVQQTPTHQLPDCEHIFLISDRAESVLELVCVIDERPQDVVEMLHVLCSLSLSLSLSF